MSDVIGAIEAFRSRLSKKSYAASQNLTRLSNRLHSGRGFTERDDVYLTGLVSDLRDLASELETSAARIYLSPAGEKYRFALEAKEAAGRG